MKKTFEKRPMVRMKDRKGKDPDHRSYRLKVVYHVQACYLDHALPRIKALSRLVDLHVILEISTEAWNCSIFEFSPQILPDGVIDADHLFNAGFPESIREYWADCRSFKMAVYNCRRSIHPKVWQISRKVCDYIKKINPDVLHLEDVSLRFSLASYQLRKIPLIISVHDPFPHWGEKNWRKDIARKLTFNTCRKFILHNQKQVPAFCRQYGLKSRDVKTIPLGVLDIYRLFGKTDHVEDPNTILFFGRLSPYKGIDILLKAAPIVAEVCPDVTFVIAGKSNPGYALPDPEPLPNNGKILLFDKYISNRDLSEFFQKAAMVVCPYVDATQSGVVLTAYGFRKPVVATDMGGLPEYVRHNETGLLVPPGDFEKLADAMISLLISSQKREALKRGIDEFVRRRLDWYSIAGSTVEAYHEIT